MIVSCSLARVEQLLVRLRDALELPGGNGLIKVPSPVRVPNEPQPPVGHPNVTLRRLR